MAWQVILGIGYFIFSLFLIFVLHGTKRRTLSNNGPVKGIHFMKIISIIKTPLFRYLKILRNNYGDIFKIKFGVREIIIINDLQTIKKMINNYGGYISNNWRFGLYSYIDNKNLMSKDYEKGFAQIVFVEKIFNNIISDQDQLTEIVQTECKYLLEDLHNSYGKNVHFVREIRIYVFNIMYKIIANKRFSKDEIKFHKYEKVLSVGNKHRNLLSLIYLLYPQFDNYQLLSKLILWIKMKAYSESNKIFEDELKAHLKFPHSTSNYIDFINKFIEYEKCLNKNGTEAISLLNSQLLCHVFELVAATYETTLDILGWSMLFMSKYPDVQRKVHKEIIEVVGKNKIPGMEDKRNLIFTQAVMDEIIRLGSPIPFGNIYKAFNNKIVNNLYIPSNSLIFLNLHSSNTDSSLWKNPNIFYPDHFLDKSNDSQLMSYTPKKELLIFDMDKKQSFAESLSKIEYFIFFTSILQNYHVSFSEEINEQQYKTIIDGCKRISRSPDIKYFNFQKI